MRFNNSVNVDFGKWSQVKMERENNMKEFRGADEEQPKYELLLVIRPKVTSFILLHILD